MYGVDEQADTAAVDAHLESSSDIDDQPVRDTTMQPADDDTAQPGLSHVCLLSVPDTEPGQ